MFVRLALVVVALVMVGLLVSTRHSYDSCQDARRTVLASAGGRLPIARLAPAIDQARDNCRGSQPLVDTAGLLFARGDVDAARRLAQEAVDAEPENALAWRALAATAAKSDPAIARQAARRQLELSPLDPPPVDPDGGP